MSSQPRTGVGRLVRSSVGVAAASLLAVLLALPVGANAGPTSLVEPSVSPTVGSPSTRFTFAVTYRNREGSAPDAVQVVVGGVAHAMTADGTQWRTGVRFTWDSTLPVGQHAVSFRSLERQRFTAEVVGATVTVAVPPTPPPTPTPTPQPTPPPTPHPTPALTPRPTSPPSPTAPATPRPTSTPTSTPGPSATVPPTTTPTASPTSPPPNAASSSSPSPSSVTGRPGIAPSTGPSIPDPSGPTGLEPAPPGASGAPTPSDDPSGLGGGSAGSGNPGDGVPPFSGPALGAWGDLTHILALGGADGLAGELRLLPALVGSVGGVTLMMAFLLFGKRRREGEPPAPDEVLSSRAGRGTADAASATLVPPAATTPGPVDAELAMPRWRRPSLLAARKADPLRAASAEAAPMTFDGGSVEPAHDRERRLIRYHVVELLDQPDELRSARVGALMQGDEVQLLDRTGPYWRVLCPDGREGWIHRTTLGEIVGAPPPPSAAETWGVNDREPDAIDDDVLTAFIAARARA